MTYEWAKPGVKVVCVEEGEWEIIPEDKWKIGSDIFPQYNQIYTIRDVSKYNDDVYIELEGFFDLYEISNFKPLVSKPKELPQTLTCLLHNPKRIVLPDQFDYKKHYDPV